MRSWRKSANILNFQKRLSISVNPDLSWFTLYMRQILIVFFLKITLLEVVFLELAFSHEKYVYLTFSRKLCETLDAVRETEKLY